MGLGVSVAAGQHVYRVAAQGQASATDTLDTCRSLGSDKLDGRIYLDLRTCQKWQCIPSGRTAKCFCMEHDGLDVIERADGPST
mgnify:CR=1 FL=1